MIPGSKSIYIFKIHQSNSQFQFSQKGVTSSRRLTQRISSHFPFVRTHHQPPHQSLLRYLRPSLHHLRQLPPPQTINSPSKHTQHPQIFIFPSFHSSSFKVSATTHHNRPPPATAASPLHHQQPLHHHHGPPPTPPNH